MATIKDPRKRRRKRSTHLAFVQAASSAVRSSRWHTVERIGNAIIGGDFTGEARGNFALDIQVTRSDPGFVASGDAAVALGVDARAAGDNSFAVGVGVAADGDNSFAIGSGANAGGARSAAFGYGSNSIFADTVNIKGPIIADALGLGFPLASWYRDGAGVEVVIVGAEVDMTVVADYTFLLPSSGGQQVYFWHDEIGLIETYGGAPATQPTVRFGVNGSLAKQHAAAITTLLNALHKREHFTPLVPQDGETSLSFGVTSASVGNLRARPYWKGLLVRGDA